MTRLGNAMLRNPQVKSVKIKDVVEKALAQRPAKSTFCRELTCRYDEKIPRQ